MLPALYHTEGVFSKDNCQKRTPVQEPMIESKGLQFAIPLQRGWLLPFERQCSCIAEIAARHKVLLELRQLCQQLQQWLPTLPVSTCWL